MHHPPPRCPVKLCIREGALTKLPRIAGKPDTFLGGGGSTEIYGHTGKNLLELTVSTDEPTRRDSTA